MNSDNSFGRWQESIGNDAAEPPPDGKATIVEGQQTKAGTPVGSNAAPGSLFLRKKTVLLVDTNPHTCDSRAKIMRTLGVTVHCAYSVGASRSRLESGSYNLVLVDLGPDAHGAENLRREIMTRNPRQLVAFLVGSPRYVATSLSGNGPKSRRLPPPAVEASVPRGNIPAAPGMDFGQRIRDAEAAAEEAASKLAADQDATRIS